MAKLLNNLSVNGNVYKIVELADEYIINGQMYDKSTFVPKPMEFLPVYGKANECSFYNWMNINCSWSGVRTMNNLLVDSNDSNINWVNLAPNIPPTLMKQIRSATNGLSTVGYGYSGTAYSDVFQFVSQTSNKIYALWNRVYDGYACYICCFDKSTGTFTYQINLGSMKIRIISENDAFMYIAACGKANSFYIYKFNKTTGAVTTLLDDSKTGYTNQCIVSEQSVKDTLVTFYASRDSIAKTPGVHQTYIVKYVLDLATEKVTATDVNLDVSLLGSTQFSLISDDSMGVGYELFTLQDGDKQYLSLVIYNLGMNSYLTVTRGAIYTFEMTDADNFKLVDATMHNPILYRGVMPMFNNKLLIFMNETGLSFFNWNTAKKKYEKTSVYQVPTHYMGVDMNNNIWVQQDDTSVDMLANTLPTNVYAIFDKDEYNFAGDDISATLTIYAQNYAGQYLASNLQLSLIGPVKFTDTGKKTRIVTTSNLNTIQIPITITGAGIVNANFKLL